ncbi:MAG: PilT/PilU family type 4a pilus ATPase [Lentisphaerae bacterium]|nr:MAG: PilT/PilU family type 4a pilus ATPase [Lentisphaerota bacterium]
MAQLDTLLQGMLNRKGSDLHLMVGLPPRIRCDGQLVLLDEKLPVLSQAAMHRLLQEICPPHRWQEFLETRDLDFAYELPGVARFRANYLFNQWGMAAVFRQIPSRILSLEDLKLPEVLKTICSYREGLVLVTGPTGSGKSTTLAAMIDYINRNESRHIITIEDPIEFVHRNRRSILVHREVGAHTRTFAEGIRGALRCDPDVILVGEMRELETIRLVLDTASMGVLVFGTLHTNNAPKTIDRIIDVFPADQQPQVRTVLAGCLSAVVSQLLCRKIGGGRVAVHEILLRHEALPNTIREGQIGNIRSIIEGSRAQGMCSMDDVLMERLKEGMIEPTEAYMKSTDKKRFASLLPDSSGSAG